LSIDLNLLPIFVAVAETSSFSAAATKLGIPKSTISRGVASLEAALGVQLFHRTTRKVSLSTAGTSLLERSGSIVLALQQSVTELPELQEAPSGTLRVTAPIDFGAAVLAEITTRFTARYPALEIDLRLTNAMVDLVGEGVDIAFRISSQPLKSSSLVAQKVGAVALQLHASPSYLARRGTPRTPQDLHGHSWVGFRGSSRLRLIGPDRPATVEARGRIVCDDMFFMRETLRASAGIGMLATFVAKEDVSSGDLVCVLPRWSVLGGQLWLVWPGGKRPPRKVVVFRDFVLESLRTRVL
jgi:DNA-binding transcriptional LysR family regulator